MGAFVQISILIVVVHRKEIREVRSLSKTRRETKARFREAFTPNYEDRGMNVLETFFSEESFSLLKAEAASLPFENKSS